MAGQCACRGENAVFEVSPTIRMKEDFDFAGRGVEKPIFGNSSFGINGGHTPVFIYSANGNFDDKAGRFRMVAVGFLGSTNNGNVGFRFGIPSGDRGLLPEPIRRCQASVKCLEGTTEESGMQNGFRLLFNDDTLEEFRAGGGEAFGDHPMPDVDGKRNGTLLNAWQLK